MLNRISTPWPPSPPTTMSGRPSPLRSPSASDVDPAVTGWSTRGANAPLPMFNNTLTTEPLIGPGPDATRSGRPSPSRSPIASARGVDPSGFGLPGSSRGAPTVTSPWKLTGGVPRWPPRAPAAGSHEPSSPPSEPPACPASMPAPPPTPSLPDPARRLPLHQRAPQQADAGHRQFARQRTPRPPSLRRRRRCIHSRRGLRDASCGTLVPSGADLTDGWSRIFARREAVEPGEPRPRSRRR